MSPKKKKKGNQGQNYKGVLLYKKNHQFQLFSKFSKKLIFFRKKLKVIKRNYLKISPSST